MAKQPMFHLAVWPGCDTQILLISYVTNEWVTACILRWKSAAELDAL